MRNISVKIFWNFTSGSGGDVAQKLLSVVLATFLFCGAEPVAGIYTCEIF